MGLEERYFVAFAAFRAPPPPEVKKNETELLYQHYAECIGRTLMLYLLLGGLHGKFSTTWNPITNFPFDLVLRKTTKKNLYRFVPIHTALQSALWHSSARNLTMIIIKLVSLLLKPAEIFYREFSCICPYE